MKSVYNPADTVFWIWNIILLRTTCSNKEANKQTICFLHCLLVTLKCLYCLLSLLCVSSLPNIHTTTLHLSINIYCSVNYWADFVVAFKAFYYSKLPQRNHASMGNHNRVIMILWSLSVTQNEPKPVQPQTLQSKSKHSLETWKIKNVSYLRKRCLAFHHSFFFFFFSHIACVW